MASRENLANRNSTTAKKQDDSLRRLSLTQVLIEEYEALGQPKLSEEEEQEFARLKAAAESEVKAADESEDEIKEGERVKSIYKIIREAQQRQAGPTGEKFETETKQIEVMTLRSALCLSGGGIRSATFNLGLLQGLARHGLLDKFDYLSTVSGGGFIGSWLSAWKHRCGLDGVIGELSKKPESPLVPDPKPVEHLRVYSNYLSPQPGLLSADTWTLIATLLRNLLLNWLVFVPVLMGLLLLPRMWAAIVLNSRHDPSMAMRLSWWIGFLAAVVALSYIGLNLPSSEEPLSSHDATSKRKQYKVRQGPFIIGCLIWLIISAAALSIYLWKWHLLDCEPISWWSITKFAWMIMALPWILCGVKLWWITRKKRPPRFWTFLFAATLLIALVQIIIGYLAAAAVTVILPRFYDYGLIYSIFSTPLVLILMGIEGVLIAGLTSRLTKDSDQEWWARAGAWVLIVAVAWSLVHLLVLYGPKVLLTLETTYINLRDSGSLRNLQWDDWAKLAATALGVLSGAITLVGGFSSKTPANSKEAQRSGTSGLLLAVLTQVLAPVFLAFLIILLSLGTNWLLISRPFQFFNRVFYQELPYPISHLSAWHTTLIEDTTFRVLLVLFAAITLVGLGMGRLISTNIFSLQYMWRNRIIRAYLGASHKDRNPNPFTNFDTHDNIHMYELWPQPIPELNPSNGTPEGHKSKKLFHVLNMALNLTGGEKLQWQDRKAESFTVSPLHAGSYWLGYRRSAHYGGKDGITLGASAAISGAFVSPNMGYMMNSAVVRFLMALFNVRFGFWLGNPGPAGDKVNLLERLLNIPLRLFGSKLEPPFRMDSPRLSVSPFFSEAVGNIDDKSSYVYLSDGGHFENLGLYEMVLRRCRFIVVCDATTDPDYSFESLAMSIRQIRVDLGVPIDIPELAVGVPSQNLKNKYCAIGKIRYSCVDRGSADADARDEDFDGILVFIKPSLIGQEPRDVINYWQGRSSFPQEIITDQWFSEAQFESYRALGSYMIDAICGDSNNPISLTSFAQKVRDHNLLNFQAFQEQISYFALEQEFKRVMKDKPVLSYQSKVRQFMDSLLR
jgi:hypothetical protein